MAAKRRTGKKSVKQDAAERTGEESSKREVVERTAERSGEQGGAERKGEASGKEEVVERTGEESSKQEVVQRSSIDIRASRIFIPTPIDSSFVPYTRRALLYREMPFIYALHPISKDRIFQYIILDFPKGPAARTGKVSSSGEGQTT